MPTATITTTSFQTALAECADAIDAEDWATATKRYAKAEVIYQGLAAETQDADSRMRWRDSLDNVKQAIDAARVMTAAADDEGRMITTQMGLNA